MYRDIMHKQAPPKATLNKWLTSYSSSKKGYGHILLEQIVPGDATIREGLRPYFESAHSDAREYFHAYAGMSLHPDAGAPGCNAKYPNCLPPKARRGVFGEVMSGLMTEALDFVGNHEWIVPVFLFRNQEDARQYIYVLSRDPARKREVLGRKGDDFIGIVVNDDGAVTRFIAGEAKWRKKWIPSVLDDVMFGTKIELPKKSGNLVHDGKGVWFEINRALDVPIGVKQLQDILQELAPDEYANVILSLDKIQQLQNPAPSERTDLILLVGGSAAGRGEGEPLLEWETKPSQHQKNRDLQVVEIILSDGDALIDALYDSLWP
ncbi:aminotransferase [Rhizobium sp. WSM1325]|uniref:aminotransferase n=1 Tax=Rhizobium sp. WSM1325 TaxID=3444086 RepID=UPI001FDF63E4|nr:aminotransferase [Rhizobium leguminosarum]